MKQKILFWIDLGVIHFGIAKFLQKEYDLFAIYDDHKKEYEFLTNEYDKKIKRYNEIKNKAL